MKRFLLWHQVSGFVLVGGLWFGIVGVKAAVSHSEALRRAEGLLAQMTLAEKIGQMTQADSDALKKHPDDVKELALGSVLSGGNSNPEDNRLETWRRHADSLQRRALQTRLKIPLLYGIDAVHGHNNVLGAVVFPHHIGLGATRNPKLVARAAQVTAREVAATGMHWAFAPCVAVAQDLRWGRTYESFSSDPAVVSELGAAANRGLQQTLPGGFQVLASTKHFAGDGGTTGGVDQGNTVADEATLRRLHVRPYAAAIQAGTKSIMVSYSSWNGEKLHGHKQLLTDVLKGELGFGGVLVSDWAAIDQLPGDYQSDIETAINAGLDMVMIPNGPGQQNNYREFIQLLTELVQEGRVMPARIDDAVRRILTVKFAAGLVENPFAGPKLEAEFGSAAHRAVARQCVRESLVLLKNEGRVLPLSKKLKHLAVMGPAANDLGRQCGGWTIDWQGEPGNHIPGGTTIWQGLKEVAGDQTRVSLVSAGGVIPPDADVVIAVVGELPYAEMKGDRADLSLAVEDQDCVARARAAGKPVVTVIVSGRPLVLGAAGENSAAVVAAWLPGTEGRGVAEVLFGKFKPKGKLSFPWPADNDSLAVGQGNPPQFPLGYGLDFLGRPLR